MLRLSEEGRQELAGLVPESGSFQALVVDQDELGLWLLVQEGQPRGEEAVSAMLLKWHHFSTLRVAFVPETPPSRERIGF